ncbi:MAG: helix-turn-helix transcriptional regulator [Sandaracinaceae bacterium]|nr:helix-turn-helix transcriptional regulator [Sandaracinaceae bacterium]
MAAVEAQRFDDVLVRELVGARLATLAARAGLSQREQDVFELLVLGRSLVEISTVLGITTRTVRFHQANVLAKLSADSRLDLMRLLL